MLIRSGPIHTYPTNSLTPPPPPASLADPRPPLQLGPDDVTSSVMSDLFVQLASKPAFHQLRTRQRLGYSVHLSSSSLQRQLGLVVRVQSPSTTPDAIAAAVRGWMEGFRGELDDLLRDKLDTHKQVCVEHQAFQVSVLSSQHMSVGVAPPVEMDYLTKKMETFHLIWRPKAPVATMLQMCVWVGGTRDEEFGGVLRLADTSRCHAVGSLRHTLKGIDWSSLQQHGCYTASNRAHTCVAKPLHTGPACF